MSVGIEMISRCEPTRIRDISEMSYLKSAIEKLPPKKRAELEKDIPTEVRIYEGKPGNRAEHMAIDVVKKVLKDASLTPSDIDFIIGAGISIHELGFNNDTPMLCISECCASYIDAVYDAWNLIKAGKCRRVLIVSSCSLGGGEGTTQDLTDPCSIQFGDDCAATIVSTCNLKCEFLSYHTETYGECYHHGYTTVRFPSNPELATQAGISTDPGTYFQVGDNTWFKYSRGAFLTDTLSKALAKANLSLHDLDHVICHHVGCTMESSWKDALTKQGLDAKTYKNRREWTGNTGHTDIPADIATFWRNGELKKDMLLAMWCPGAGMQLSTLIFRWLSETFE